MKVDLPYTIKLNPLAVILGSFFILLIPFLLWSYFAKLEQISRANGQVIAVSKKQAIQSANDGVVKDIYVKEGQLVKKGEVIARLELSEFKADVEAIKANIAATEAHISRLKAEVFKKDLVFTPLSLEYPEFVSSQKELFKRKQDALNDEIKVLQSALKLARDDYGIELLNNFIELSIESKIKAIMYTTKNQKEYEILNQFIKNEFTLDSLIEINIRKTQTFRYLYHLLDSKDKIDFYEYIIRVVPKIKNISDFKHLPKNYDLIEFVLKISKVMNYEKLAS